MTRLLVAAGLLLGTLLSASASASAAATDVQRLDRIVAVVNDDVVTETELDREIRTVQKRLEEQNVPVPDPDKLRSQVLNRLITKRLQLQLAQKTGIHIDDETLNHAIERIAEQNNMPLAKLRQVIERDGFSFAAFREDIRDEITISRLKQRQVENNIIVTDQEVNQFLAGEQGSDIDNDEFHIEHILVAVPDSAGPDKIQAARRKAEHLRRLLTGGADFKKVAIEYSDGRQALDGGDLGWRKANGLPTFFSRVVPAMRVGEISDVIRSPSGFHLIKLVERRGGKRHMVTEHHVRHILIKTNDVVNDNGARQKLLRLRERAERGEDFATLARAYSDDKATAGKGGDLGWVKPSEVDPEFEQVIDKLKPNDISNPFETRFGWHIVQLLDKRQVDDTEEYNRAKARAIIHDRKTEEEYQQWLRRLRDEAYVDVRLKK